MPYAIRDSEKVQFHQFLAHRMTRPPRLLLWFGLILLLIVASIVAALIFVPWRQTVVGQGEVSVFDPLDRPQTVESQLKGRLVELLVQEGQTVEQGQVLARLEDRDSKFLDPAQGQRLDGQQRALREKIAAAQQRIAALEQQLLSIDSYRQAGVNSASAKVRQAQQKLVVARQQIRIGEQDVETAQLQFKRIQTLNQDGLKSDRDLELAQQKLVETETKLQKMTGELTLLEQEIELADLEIPKLQAEAAEKSQKVRESIAKAFETISETEEKLQKLANESGTLKVRRSLLEVVAPRSGRVVALKKLGVGQLLKEGDVIATITPEREERGVELYFSGLDSPLLETGGPVRLMFEGFPAVPFVGWEWSSVGTFGGRIASIDPVITEDKEKQGFRVWVLPDPEEAQWPPRDRLRLGSRVNGWAMLNQVPLYYELWRQLNAFPAIPYTEADGKTKKPKTKPVIRR